MRKILLLAFSLFLAPACLRAAAGEPYDLLIKGGLLVDGTGGPPMRADVAFKDGRVAKVGDLSAARSAQTVDATDKVVIPGILDLLCHNDLLWTPLEQKRALRRGATFGLVGNCGFSLLHVGQNLDRLEKQHKLLLNVGTLIAQGSVREAIMKKLRRAPVPAEMVLMKKMVEDALKEGAFGLSSGLGYEPGEWSSPEEIEALAAILPKYPHASYFTHIRNFRSDVLPALEEAVHVAETYRVPTVVQHLLFKMPSNWDQADPGLRLLEKARAEGHPIWATVYPYDFWGNEVQIPLQQLLYLRDTAAKWTTYMRQPAKYDEVIQEIGKRLAEYGEPRRVEITHLPAWAPKDWLGLRLDEFALRRGMSPRQAVLALLLETKNDVGVCYHGVSESVLIRQIQAPYVLFGSDAAKDIPHPRNAGSFPRLLSRYVRDLGVIRLSEAVERLCREPAQLLGLKDRGELREGFWGDAVVLDWEKLEDRATPIDPWEPPVGVDVVVVNGRVVLEGDRLTGEAPGQVLRRSGEAEKKP
jgi:N-acyl-D-amino-acid deacylase